MNLWQVVRSWGEGRATGERMSFDEYVSLLSAFSFGGNAYQGGGVQQTLVGGDEAVERSGESFAGLVHSAYASNGVVFACMLARQLAFSSVRFQWQTLNNGRPSKMFGTKALEVLERPWVGGTTQDLLTRVINDADLAGSSYTYLSTPLARLGGDGGQELVRLRPDWVNVALVPRMVRGSQVGWRRVGYLYTEGGSGVGGDTVPFTLSEVAQFTPILDPLASWRGMSWLTPVIREIQADHQMTRHKAKFFENGAPQPLDARVLTPTGWSTMGEMAPGRRVVGSDGKPRTVVAVYPQGERKVYRVRFTDGTVVRCTADHLWSVTRHHGTPSERVDTLTLAQMVDGGLCYASGAPRFSVPYVDPVEYDPAGTLPIDPYLLGSLLGDGWLGERAVSLATHTDDADEQERLLTPLLLAGVSMVRRDRGGSSTEWNLRGTARVNALMVALRSLGIAGVTGEAKAAPESYLRASVGDRVALLQGLMDTDGSAEGAAARFTTTSCALAEQVADLALGLGGRAVVRPVQREGLPQWVVTVSRLPEWVVPFRLARKVTGYRPAKRVARFRHIASVDFDGLEPAQCIAVDSPDHLYVTDGYVLTHNTPNMVVKYPVGVQRDEILKLAKLLEAEHGGIENAYRTMHFGGGADVTVVGANMEQVTFKELSGVGETRIAAAARVSPVIVGLSEGLQGSALNAGNYGQARRQFADGTCHPMWQGVSGSFEPLLGPRPGTSGTRLWYDTREVPFLREDEKDAASIQQMEANTIRTLLDAGYTADSVREAVEASDWGLLKHSGMFSVQLQTPGAASAPPDSADPAPVAPPEGQPE